MVETSLGKGMDPDSEYLPSLPDDEKLAAIGFISFNSKLSYNHKKNWTSCCFH